MKIIPITPRVIMPKITHINQRYSVGIRETRNGRETRPSTAMVRISYIRSETTEVNPAVYVVSFSCFKMTNRTRSPNRAGTIIFAVWDT